MDKKGHLIDHRGIIMCEKNWTYDTFFLGEYLLAEWGGTPLIPPITKNHFSQEPLTLNHVLLTLTLTPP